MHHVPKTNSSNLIILSFREALRRSKKPTEAFDVSKWLYVPPFYSEYRYILGTRGNSPLVVLGVNPSTASPDDLDPTLKSAQRISLYNGYDSFLMMNVYPQRATDPNDMDKTKNDFLEQENLEAFRYVIGISKSRDVWCAWGNVVDKRSYLCECVKNIFKVGNALGAKWLCAEKALKTGNPHHPLYLKANTKLIPYSQAYE